MEGLSLELILISVAVMALSALCQCTTGVGYASLFMLVMTSAISYSGALALMYIGYAITMACIIFKTMKNVDFKKCWHIGWPCLITNALGIMIGTLVMMKIEAQSPQFLMILCGVVTAVISLYFFFIGDKIKIKPTIPKGLALGGLGGLMAGFVGLGGPPIAIYTLNSTKDANEYLGALQIPYIAGTAMGILVNSVKGYYSPQILSLFGIGIIPTIAASLLGIWLANKINKKVLKRIIYAAMLVMAAIMIIQNI